MQTDRDHLSVKLDDPSKGAGTSLRASLEAKILTAPGDKSVAQDLRWQAFEQTLDTGNLREHVAALADFAEVDVLDRAFAHALSHADRYKALEFFLPRPSGRYPAQSQIESRS